MAGTCRGVSPGGWWCGSTPWAGWLDERCPSHPWPRLPKWPPGFVPAALAVAWSPRNLKERPKADCSCHKSFAVHQFLGPGAALKNISASAFKTLGGGGSSWATNPRWAGRKGCTPWPRTGDRWRTKARWRPGIEIWPTVSASCRRLSRSQW